MSSCNKTYTVYEYGGFTSEKEVSGYTSLPKNTFEALENFIIANNTGDEANATEPLSLSVRRGAGKIITARNYVGTITMTNGTVIEILPKIAGDSVSEDEARRVFIQMLKTLRIISFKVFNMSRLNTARLSLFECFIEMFLDEVSAILKQGVNAAYTPAESNEHFYKGKLLVSQNIKHNLVNKEHFFVRYDDYTINRPENKLIKSALGLLVKMSKDSRNRNCAARLLSLFDGVDFSKNYDADFSKCFLDRRINHYKRALSWCRVFLYGNSFSSFSGSKIALALLFPMEKIFEKFVAEKFRKYIGHGVNLKTQDSSYWLFDSPNRAFALRPDIVLECGGHTVIMDTKWKLLSDKAINSNISQSDMYQMYAYSMKYRADRVVLLYPRSDAVSGSSIRYSSNDNVNVDIFFIDLLKSDESIADLYKNFCNPLIVD